MSSAPYTLQSLVRLSERENRRGNDISRHDPGVRRANQALQNRRRLFRRTIAKYEQDDPVREILRKNYKEDRKKLRLNRETAVEVALHEALLMFETNINQDTFDFGLMLGPVVETKQTYCTGMSLDILFPAKQASAVLKTTELVSGSSRNSIVRALKEALKREYTHGVYKVDIQSFFESIPHSTLLDKLARRSSVDGLSMKLVRQLLAEYESLTGNSVGLPRGVGLSSQLSELYMSDFDFVCKTHPGVLFYARYVDDVVLIVENEQALTNVKNTVMAELRSLKLTINAAKTREIVADTKGQYPPVTNVEYLGYKFSKSGKTLVTGLTDNRKNRRLKRLNLALDRWLETTPEREDPNHGHDGLLVDRVRYLASNTKLVNSKSEVAIGLYHSNSALDTGASELVELDEVLAQFLVDHGSEMTDDVATKLQAVSFVNMFLTRPFLRFRPKRMDQITRIWLGVKI